MKSRLTATSAFVGNSFVIATDAGGITTTATAKRQLHAPSRSKEYSQVLSLVVSLDSALLDTVHSSG